MSEAVMPYNSTKPSPWKAKPASDIFDKVPLDVVQSFEEHLQKDIPEECILYPPFNNEDSLAGLANLPPKSGESVWALVLNDHRDAERPIPCLSYVRPVLGTRRWMERTLQTRRRMVLV